MNVKELRIGNWIYDEDGILCKVIGFAPFGHSVQCDEEEGCEILVDLYPQDGTIRRGYATDSTIVKPVETSPELLKRFGFVPGKSFDDYSNIFYLGGFMVSLDDYINVFVDWADDGKDEYGEDTYHSIACYEELHLHTLQNLYFALTFKELEFLN